MEIIIDKEKCDGCGLCIELCPADEPVFVIRAQDACAYETVMRWALIAEQKGVDPAMVAEARAHAVKMAEWPVKKIPDMT